MHRKTALWTLIVSQIAYVLFGIVWLFVSAMSVMMFDNPNGDGNASFWIVYILFLLYPMAIIAAMIGGWVFFFRRNIKAALIWNGVPIPWILTLIGIILFVTLD